MKIVEPFVELWEQNDEDSHIARCARVCYASDKGDDKKLCQALWKSRHYSMYRHFGKYYIIPTSIGLPDRGFIDVHRVLYNGKWYVSVNLQTALNYFGIYKKYEISSEEAEQNEIFWKYKLLRYTFCVDSSLIITREYNRKSPNNIAEQSTRYVDFNKKVGIRFLKSHWMYKLNLYKKGLTWMMLKLSEWFYKIARSKYGLNLPPEDARCFLPVDVMSRAIYTYTVRDWEYIINMRLYHWTGKAHKDAEIIASKIWTILTDMGYNINKYNKD